MNSLPILHAENTLDIRKYLVYLRVSDARGLWLDWHREGMVGRIDPETIGDLLAIYDAYEAMQQRGRIIDMPAAAYTLTWDQCFDVKCESDR